MTSFACACLWLVLMNLRVLFPSRDRYWRFAYAMMALGVPLGVWVFLDHGWIGVLVLMLAASSLLRWPLWYGWRWVRGKVNG